MNIDEIFANNEVEPDIAALLGDVGVPSPKTQSRTATVAAGFDSMFSDMAVDGLAKEKSPVTVDLTVDKFQEVTVFFNDTPHKFFDDPNYYKKALGGEGDKAQRLHALLTKYLSAQDPKDRGVFRQQIITAYWDLLQQIAPKATGSNPPPEKKYMLRFGMLLPSLLTPEHKTLFASVIDKNDSCEPIFYLDEWINCISNGSVTPSATDEAKVSKNDNSSHFKQLLSRAEGKLQSAENLLKSKTDERTRCENVLKGKVESIAQHESLHGFMHVKAPYTEQQKHTFQEISEEMRALVKIDKELQGYVVEFENATNDIRSLTEKIKAEGGDIVVDTQSILTEMGTLRQMTKMTIGRQGNHFPILSKDYFHNNRRDIGVRENIIKTLAWIESIDTEAYCRQYKNQLNRIVPYTILIPSYGDFGVCWEPFDRYNRATSRGRIAIPMYPKNLTIAVLTAVGDLRWQVAKEKASSYWMEEGLTGHYYQYIAERKIKGELKDLFINDYILWMTKECEGVQRLDKELRGVFWRFMPFSPEVKEKLKTRSYVYQELCQRDMNRQMSDGY